MSIILWWLLLLLTTILRLLIDNLHSVISIILLSLLSIRLSFILIFPFLLFFIINLLLSVFIITLIKSNLLLSLLINNWLVLFIKTDEFRIVNWLLNSHSNNEICLQLLLDYLILWIIDYWIYIIFWKFEYDNWILISGIETFYKSILLLIIL